MMGNCLTYSGKSALSAWRYTKEETGASVPMEQIYIPLRLVAEGASDDSTGYNPLQFIEPGDRRVVLGDPGSGKSTLFSFLALAGIQSDRLGAYGAKHDSRLSILSPLRAYTDVSENDADEDLLQTNIEWLRKILDLPDLSREFLDYYLVAGDSLLLLDGIDELSGSRLKQKIRRQVTKLLADYPGTTALLSSRIVGYDQEEPIP